MSGPSEFHKTYLVGWSFVDFRRLWHHYQLPDEHQQQHESDISFLCPNKTHVELLNTILMLWGVDAQTGVKYARGHGHGGHTICMLSIDAAGVPELKERMHETFDNALARNPVAFLRGYFDHQVISGVPFHGGYHARFNRHQRWSYEKVRITFSSVEHLDGVRTLSGLSDVGSWEIIPASANAPMISAMLQSQDALAFLSWLASENPQEGPACPFFGNVIIPRIVGFLRRTEGISPKTHDAKPGFSVRLNVGRITKLWDNVHVGTLFAVATEAELPAVQPDSPAQLILKPVAATAVGKSFLERCMHTPSEPECAGEVRVLFAGGFSGFSPDTEISPSDLQIEVTLIRREWIVPSKIVGAVVH